MVDILDTLNAHVAHVYLYYLSYKCCKDFVDKSLVNGSDIRQGNGKCIIALQASVNKEGRFLLIFLGQRDLIIA